MCRFQKAEFACSNHAGSTKLSKLSLSALTFEQCENLLLSNCPNNRGVIGSHDLLTRCENQIR